MKGVVVIVALAVTLLGCIGTSVANPPIVPPVQYEQFCEGQQVSGTGIVDMSTTVKDKRIALEYYEVKTGDGDLELNQEQVYSQNSDKIKRQVNAINNTHESNLNLFDKTQMTYQGKTPLTGGKYLKSKTFYGGIGADIQEMYSVNEMEQDAETFFTSTTPYNSIKKVPCISGELLGMGEYPGYYPESFTVSQTSENLINDLKAAGRDTEKVSELMNSQGNNPAHLIGFSTKNTFNGTWGTDATWHKIFYKDVKAHEMFTGQFEAVKTLKFHENPVPEIIQAPCAGVDC